MPFQARMSADGRGLGSGRHRRDRRFSSGPVFPVLQFLAHVNDGSFFKFTARGFSLLSDPAGRTT
jgi:hypothetical protein